MTEVDCISIAHGQRKRGGDLKTIMTAMRLKVDADSAKPLFDLQ